MAWPATPLTTYVANTVPAIKADDLNAFQNGINGIINGTYSVKGLLIDGTGGVVATPPAGSITAGSVIANSVTANSVTAGSVRVTRAVSGTSFPNTVVPLGEVNLGQTPAGIAYVNADGTLKRGINVQSTARRSIGLYQIIWNIRCSSNGDGVYFPLATLQDSFLGFIFCEPFFGTPSVLDVHTFNPAHAASDRSFVAVVFGV